MKKAKLLVVALVAALFATGCGMKMNLDVVIDKDKNINYPKANIKVEKNDDYSLKISTDNFARGIYINCHNNNIILSDNFFDLNAGSTKIITTNQKINTTNLDILCVNNINYPKQRKNR